MAIQPLRAMKKLANTGESQLTNRTAFKVSKRVPQRNADAQVAGAPLASTVEFVLHE